MGTRKDNLQQKPGWLRRFLGYFSVLRPHFAFGALIVYLPLTVLQVVPGHSILGNLFVEYQFSDGFWFGMTLFGAAWAVMITAGLTLDIERDREELAARPSSGVYGLGKAQRRLTIPFHTNACQGNPVRTGSPLRRDSPFLWFSLLGVPGFVMVVCGAEDWVAKIWVGCGLLFGGFLTYLLLDLTVYFGRCDDDKFYLFSWRSFSDFLPRSGILGWLYQQIARLLSWGTRILSWLLPLGSDIFKGRLLKGDHLFAAFSLLEVSFAYGFVYCLLKKELVQISSIPPAAFLYLLLLPIIWLVSALWIHFQRYRIVLLGSIVVGLILYGIGSIRFVEKTIGGSAHTYDLFRVADEASLQASEVLTALQKIERDNGKKPSLIIVAASGGGILAAGWTTQVLTELHQAYPHFSEELRLISAVSGGAVGAMHYVSAFPEKGSGKVLPARTLKQIVDDAMQSSLAITAFGFAFPDFRRALMPLWIDETFDRARLLEADWRQTANAHHPKRRSDTRVLLSQWTQDIREGNKPAVILNATIMETGERIAITPIASLKNSWAGLTRANSTPCPIRRIHARTLAEFFGTQERYDVDIWTAARLSATFSYVSPAARASFATPHPDADGHIERSLPPPPAVIAADVSCHERAGRKSNGLLHLIDGGYHDNYGVVSALDWLTAALAQWPPEEDFPFARVALVEIRAKADIPQEKAASQWTAAWLGPLQGILNSWGFSQASTNDTAINRLIERFPSQFPVPFQSFVFVPEGQGPLSWHLSEKQKEFVRNSWNCPSIQATRQDFLAFVRGQEPKNQTAPGPLDPMRPFARDCTASH